MNFPFGKPTGISLLSQHQVQPIRVEQREHVRQPMRGHGAECGLAEILLQPAALQEDQAEEEAGDSHLDPAIEPIGVHGAEEEGHRRYDNEDRVRRTGHEPDDKKQRQHPEDDLFLYRRPGEHEHEAVEILIPQRGVPRLREPVGRQEMPVDERVVYGVVHRHDDQRGEYNIAERAGQSRVFRKPRHETLHDLSHVILLRYGMNDGAQNRTLDIISFPLPSQGNKKTASPRRFF